MGIFVVLLLIIFIIYGFEPRRFDSYRVFEDRSQTILRERYARGEVSREEYLRMKDSLR
jgi:uncharacterized membrane protein